MKSEHCEFLAGTLSGDRFQIICNAVGEGRVSQCQYHNITCGYCEGGFHSVSVFHNSINIINYPSVLRVISG